MSLAEYAALAVAGGVAAESTGVTDFTPIGGDEQDLPGGGGLPNLPPGLGGIPPGLGELPPGLAELPATVAAATQSGGGVVQRTAETIEKVPVPTTGSIDPGDGLPDYGLPEWIDGGPGGDREPGGGDPAGSLTPEQRAALATGRDPFGLQVTNPGPLGTAAELLNVGGDTAADAGEFGTDFAGENPYFSAGTAGGAALGSVIPFAGTAAGAATGAAIGGTAEVTADTVTGGTPLGVQSPIDIGNDGAIYEGPDPFNLGPGSGSDDDDDAEPVEQDDGGSDPAAATNGTNREQDKTDPGDSGDEGYSVGPVDGIKAFDGPFSGVTDLPGSTPSVSIDPGDSGGSDQQDGDELRGSRGESGSDPADADAGINREQDKTDPDERNNGVDLGGIGGDSGGDEQDSGGGIVPTSGGGGFLY